MKHIAIDLGASSGRVIAGEVSDRNIEITEIKRFNNCIVPVPEGDSISYYWDLHRLWSNILEALRAVGSFDTIGIDTWAVDYVLLDRNKRIIGNSHSYRDTRTRGISDKFSDLLSPQKLYQCNGLQKQDFNTMFQLIAEDSQFIELTDKIALLPDMLGYWLTGELVSEVTNSSTTGLVNPSSRSWSSEVFAALASFKLNRANLFGELVEPGTKLGKIRKNLSLGSGNVITVATHDTASAVAAIPARDENFAFISCGTWSLVGKELDSPVLSEQARTTNFTNELGINKTVRFLKNIMGLWIFNECYKQWRAVDPNLSYEKLAVLTEKTEPGRSIIDINNPVFYEPGNMQQKIHDFVVATGQQTPRNPAEYYRCILESLSLAYAEAISQIEELTDSSVDEIYLVGGGSKNRVLCQMTADAACRPVFAGPAEGTALGNLFVQMQAVGEIDLDRNAVRNAARSNCPTIAYMPQQDLIWEKLKERKQSWKK